MIGGPQQPGSAQPGTPKPAQPNHLQILGLNQQEVMTIAKVDAHQLVAVEKMEAHVCA
tara:strand:- start:26 stop:199 length:174 start_codon:yes stop_codon:yes gene_type:complete